ncbi:hypothetical protein Tco_1552174 [Tanacetum coccineum]
MRTPRLSLDVNYAVHLVFKFCGKSSAKSVKPSMHITRYGETRIGRRLNIEFVAIDNLKQEDIEKTMAIQQQLVTYSEKRSANDYEGGELFSLKEINIKKHLMLSAMVVLYNCSNVEPFLMPRTGMNVLFGLGFGMNIE